MGEYYCVSPCPDGYYADSTTGYCELCIVIADCAECTEDLTSLFSATCTVCNSPLILDQDGNCVYECSGSSYSSTCDDDVACCASCEDPCDECEDADTCTTCLTDYLYEGDCVNPCPSGYYQDDSNICQDCDTTCLTCNGLTD